MKPALLSYPHISSYPALLLLGFFFGWILARRRAGLFGLQKRHFDNISLLLPLAGLFGARFFANLFYAKKPFLEALKVSEGDGLVFYGGFLFGIAAIIAYALARRIPIVSFLDCLAPSAALGLAFGRVGCFLAGCCWGDLCIQPQQLAALEQKPALEQIHTFPALSTAGNVFAVQFPPKTEPFKQHQKLGLLDGSEARSLPVHPVQLYEAVLALGLAFMLHHSTRKHRHSLRPGDLSIGLLAGYAFIRFCTEYFRADNKAYLFSFTFSQVVSLWIAAFCILLIAGRFLLRKERSISGASQSAVLVESVRP